MYECDLHTHTNRSDGHVSPVESIERAAVAGLKVQAITDHDTILPLVYETEQGALNLEHFAAERGVELLRGIEISCDTNNEDVHLIGLYCDWENPAFAELEQFVRQSRARGYQGMVDCIAKAGYAVEWEEILADCGLLEHPERICKKHIFEYLARKGYAPTWDAAKKWIQSAPEFNVLREKPDPLKMIELIHQTGGIAILAHPFLIRECPVYGGKQMERYSYMDMLVEAGLNGIEACYTYDKTSYRGTFSRQELEGMVRKRYEGSGIFFSGGSDFHGDFKKGMVNPRELGECGISYEDYCRDIKR